MVSFLLELALPVPRFGAALALSTFVDRLSSGTCPTLVAKYWHLEMTLLSSQSRQWDSVLIDCRFSSGDL